MIDKVDISKLSDVLKKELDNYRKSVYTSLVETCDEGIKEAKKEIIREFDTLKKGSTYINSSGGSYQIVNDNGGITKHYRSSFTTRKNNELSRVLWNTKYQLSHLLENGHYVYNQHGGNYMVKKSAYGDTPRKETYKFGVWDKTEKHTADYVSKKLLQKLK